MVRSDVQSFLLAKEFLRTLDNNLYRFIVGKRVIPPTDEVKRLTIEEYSKNFSINILIETGTYLGETIDALKNKFVKLISIELDTVLFEKARAKFGDFSHISILHGNSSQILQLYLASIHEPALFWLDGHYSGTGTAKGEFNTPILGELKAILNHPIKSHVILIDDARCFVGENGYPTMKDLFSFINKINRNLRFVIEDDIIRILPRDKFNHSNLSTYKESWRQVAGRCYRRLRQPVRQLFLMKKN